MASIDATISFLEKLPEDIRIMGEQVTKSSIISNGNYDTGNMYNSVNAFVHGDHIQIVVWTRYAKWVNDGHGGAAPGHVMSFKISPKWPGYVTKSGNARPYAAHRVSGYEGSGFFDQAYTRLLAYIQTL